MTISQVGSLVNSTVSPLVFGSTPTNGDLIIFTAQSTATITPPSGFTQGMVVNGNPAAGIWAKIASSETNSYAYSGITGTGAAANGMVFRATNGWDTPAALLASSGATSADPAGNPTKASSLLITSMRNSGSSVGATTTWNGGSAGTPANATGRGGADFLILTSAPADTKVVWSLGTEVVLVNYTEATPAGTNSGFFAFM